MRISHRLVRCNRDDRLAIWSAHALRLSRFVGTATAASDPGSGPTNVPTVRQGVNAGWRLDLLFAYFPHCGASLGIVSGQQNLASCCSAPDVRATRVRTLSRMSELRTLVEQAIEVGRAIFGDVVKQA